MKHGRTAAALAAVTLAAAFGARAQDKTPEQYRAEAEAYEAEAARLLGEAPAGAAAAPAPAPAGRQMAGGPGLPVGLFNCHGIGGNSFYAVVRRVQITGPGSYVLWTYNDREKLPGSYAYAGGRVRWTSGPLATGSEGTYGPDGVHDSPRLQVMHDSQAFNCFLSGG